MNTTRDLEGLIARPLRPRDIKTLRPWARDQHGRATSRPLALVANKATSQGADPPNVRGTMKCARQSGGPAGYAISSRNGLISGQFAQLRHMPLSGCPPHRGARFRGVPARARLRPSSQRKPGYLYAAFSV